MKRIKIYLVRHGEVENPQEIIYGRLPNFGLNQFGENQVKKVGGYLKSVNAKPEIIFTSPLLRALQTAKIITDFFPAIKIKKVNLLTEGDLGWQGKKKTDLIKTGIWQIYLDQPSAIKTGEGFEGLQQRAVKWLKQFLKKNTYEEVLVVSHQDIIRSLTLFLEKRFLDDLNKIPAETGSVTTVKIDKSGNLLSPIIYWESACRLLMVVTSPSAKRQFILHSKSGVFTLHSCNKFN